MYQALATFDVIEKFKDTLLERGWYIDCETGKITCRDRVVIEYNTPWVHPNPDPDRKCSIYQAMFNLWMFVPKRCLDCYKVVVHPGTLYELMRLYDFQMKFTADHQGQDRYCKCGVEERNYVPFNYGGYFYCNSLEQGKYRYKQVREAMDKINPEMHVILKRYCTEFEVHCGPSNKYERPEWADGIESRVWDILDIAELVDNPRQPKYLEEHVMRKWIEFAFDRSDPTALMFNDNKPLCPPCITYQPGGTAYEKENTEDGRDA